MKKLVSVLFLSLLSVAAYADQTIQLNVIHTDDCNRARNEVRLLASTTVSVDADCNGPGYYPDQNGRVYGYELTTSITVSGDVYSGEPVELGYIDTNDCNWAKNEISLLNSDSAPITTSCSPYIPGGYSDNGRSYNYRLYTSVTPL